MHDDLDGLPSPSRSAAPDAGWRGAAATLARQLRGLGLEQGSSPQAQAFDELLEAVSDAYGEADDERCTLERSIDVSSRGMRGLHEVLSRQALQDALTGLPNRAALLAHPGRPARRCSTPRCSPGSTPSCQCAAPGSPRRA